MREREQQIEKNNKKKDNKGELFIIFGIILCGWLMKYIIWSVIHKNEFMNNQSEMEERLENQAKNTHEVNI